MNKSKVLFKKGDRVRVTFAMHIDECIDVREGMTGTVIDYDVIPMVVFDLHSSKREQGEGCGMHETQLELI